MLTWWDYTNFLNGLLYAVLFLGAVAVPLNKILTSAYNHNMLLMVF